MAERRGRTRVHQGRIEISAYAGTNPVTGKAARLTERLPLGTSDLEVGRRLSALVVRADDVAVTRRARRRGELPAERPGRTVEHTVGDALEAWYDAHGRHLASAHTARHFIDSYLAPLSDVALWRLRGHVGRLEAERDPDLLDLGAFYRQLTTRSGTLLAPSSVERIHRGTLHPAIVEAIRQGWVTGDPTLGVRLPKGDEPEDTTPQPDEARTFLAYVGPRHRDLYAFCLLVASGPRPTETAAIRLEDVDLDAGTLTLHGHGVVREKQVGKKEQWVVRRGATTKRRKRVVALDATTVAAVRLIRDDQAATAAACGLVLGRRAYLFSHEPDGSEPMSPNILSMMFRRYVTRARAAGIDLPIGMSLYDYRHFGITTLLHAGRSVADVADRFGTSQRMIQERYAHRIKAEGARMADTMNDVWGTPEPDAVVVQLRRR